MTCKETEQMVMPYINDELTDKELASFLKHIYGCKNCYEELEVYYTIYAGLQQLESESDDYDMHNLLKETLRVSESRVKGRKLFNTYYVLLQIMAIISLIVIIIMGFPF